MRSWDNSLFIHAESGISQSNLESGMNVHALINKSWKERWIRPLPFTGCDGYSPIRIMFSIF